MNNINEAFIFVIAMGAVILFCRAFPFLFFSRTHFSEDKNETGKPGSSRPQAFLVFVEKTVPPVAMTVLAFNALGASFRESPHNGLLVFAASVFTTLLHLWKRNSLLSILGGTVLYMVLIRVF